jgi:hypothetical protein
VAAAAGHDSVNLAKPLVEARLLESRSACPEFLMSIASGDTAAMSSWQRFRVNLGNEKSVNRIPYPNDWFR